MGKIRTTLVAIEQERRPLADGRVQFQTKVQPQGGRSVFEHVHVGDASSAAVVDAVARDLGEKLLSHDDRADEFSSLAGAVGSIGELGFRVLDSHVRILGPAKWELLLEWEEWGADGVRARRELAVETSHPLDLPAIATMRDAMLTDVRARAKAVAAAADAADFTPHEPVPLQETFDVAPEKVDLAVEHGLVEEK